MLHRTGIRPDRSQYSSKRVNRVKDSRFQDNKKQHQDDTEDQQSSQSEVDSTLNKEFDEMSSKDQINETTQESLQDVLAAQAFWLTR